MKGTIDRGYIPDVTPLTITGDCPNKANHTPCPSGYNEWHDWARMMAQTHRQITCESCGLYEIWLPKAEAAKALAERRQRMIEADRECRREVAEKIRESKGVKSEAGG